MLLGWLLDHHNLWLREKGDEALATVANIEVHAALGMGKCGCKRAKLHGSNFAGLLC